MSHFDISRQNLAEKFPHRNHHEKSSTHLALVAHPFPPNSRSNWRSSLRIMKSAASVAAPVRTNPPGDPRNSAAPAKMKTFSAEIERVSRKPIRAGRDEAVLRPERNYLHAS